MFWDCGLLDDPLGPREKLNTIRRSNWYNLPEDLERELRLWLAMPGFTVSYHVETLEHEPRLVKAFMGGYEKFSYEVAENWVSATRDDCIRLGYLRPEKGDLPLLTKLQIRSDYYQGSVQKDLAEEYGVYPATVNKLVWGLPDEVEKLPGEILRLVVNDRHLSSTSRKAASRPRLPRIGDHVIAPEWSFPVSVERVNDALLSSTEQCLPVPDAPLPPNLEPERLLEILDGVWALQQEEERKREMDDRNKAADRLRALSNGALKRR